MINKPERVIKRIIKAVGQGQSALIIGSWQEELVTGIQANNSSVTPTANNKQQLSELPDNSYTRVIADYNLLVDSETQSSILNPQSFFNEARRLLLPTGQIIITAIAKEWFLEKFIRFIKRTPPPPKQDALLIKPKLLQDLAHDNGFLIEAYNGYPNGQLLLIAQIIDKEVSTLYSSEKQETISYHQLAH